VHVIRHARWLDTLAPGDEVAIVSPGICVEIERVARVRADGRVVTVLGHSTRTYRVSDGQRIGVEIEEHLEPVTQEHRDAVEHQDLGRWLRAVAAGEPTLEQLRAMRAAHARAGQPVARHEVERSLAAHRAGGRAP
jgi:hypothetical protein